jgi:hypothetical protein
LKKYKLPEDVYKWTDDLVRGADPEEKYRLDKFIEDIFRDAGDLVVKLFNPYNIHPGLGAKKMYYCRA